MVAKSIGMIIDALHYTKIKEEKEIAKITEMGSIKSILNCVTIIFS